MKKNWDTVTILMMWLYVTLLIMIAVLSAIGWLSL